MELELFGFLSSLHVSVPVCVSRVSHDPYKIERVQRPRSHPEWGLQCRSEDFRRGPIVGLDYKGDSVD